MLLLFQRALRPARATEWSIDPKRLESSAFRMVTGCFAGQTPTFRSGGSFSPLILQLGWEHINLTGDYVWRPYGGVRNSRLRPLRLKPQRFTP